ncbi:MAG: flagellar basal body protein FliL [Alphaproteobacteria bacterium]|nr:flagellar basal body protein FliL [Alphaproteobacteria bacterium]
MSDAIEQGDHDDEEHGSKGGKKKLIFIILGVLLLGGGGAAAYFMGLIPGMKKEHVEGEAPAEGEHAEGGEHGAAPASTAAKTIYYNLPEFLVNLSSASNQTSYVKMKVTLVLGSEADSLVAQERLPVLQDHFNTYLRDLRASDLSGSAGMYRLREELLARANKSLSPVKVQNILFNEILVQ